VKITISAATGVPLTAPRFISRHSAAGHRATAKTAPVKTIIPNQYRRLAQADIGIQHNRLGVPSE
jgi:hypothetical protein